MKKALITIGSTREYIDPVRYISNESSGRQGMALIKSLLKSNYKIICLHGYIQVKQIVSKNVKYIFTSKGASQLGGFGAIGNMFPSQWNWKGFWSSTALISIILAFMNILPIPALDGGHVMFLFYEIVTGRKPNDKFMEYAQMFGFFLLLALVLYANGNDLFRAFFS